MGRLDAEARMAIKVLSARGSRQSEIARLLRVTEGAVRQYSIAAAKASAFGRCCARPSTAPADIRLAW